MSLTLPLGRYCLRVADRSRPLPLSIVLLLRKFSAGADSLTPKKVIADAGSDLHHPILRRFLAQDEIGVWTLCAKSLNFLEQQIHTHRPNVVLEFGSGISTLCLAQFMHDIHGDSDRIYVCSIEQSAAVMESTLRRLSELKLRRYVRPLNSPLVRQQISDREIPCYEIAEGDMGGIGLLRPDFLLVDGPAAESGARFGTLLQVRDVVAPDVRVYLDDAFRDGELDIAQSWLRLPGMTIDGVLPTPKGLMVGRLRNMRD